MKKLISCMLSLVMVISLTACGASGTNSEGTASAASASGSVTQADPGGTADPAVPETEEPTEAETPVPEPEVWNENEEFVYDYEDIVLFESENVKISAYRLQYKKSEERGWRIQASVVIKNLTDHTLTYGSSRIEDFNELEAGASNTIFVASAVYDWNHLIGETEDCFQKTCQLKIADGGTIVDMIQFDWYISKRAPFTNLLVGEENIRKAALEKDLVTETLVEGEEADKFYHTYDGSTVLLENESFRITADHLNSYKTAEGADTRAMSLGLIVQNKTDKVLQVSYKNSAYIVSPQESTPVNLHIDDWNGLIGGTENCRQGVGQLIIQEEDHLGAVVGAVRFDWYSSTVDPFRNIITGEKEVLEAERQAELAALRALEPVLQLKNELFDLDIVKVESRYGSYQITYIATNTSKVPLYVEGQRENWEDSYWTPSRAWAPGESWFDSVGYSAEHAFEGGKTSDLSVVVHNAIRQPVGELTLSVKGDPAVSKEGEIPDPPCEFAETKNEADVKAAEAFPEIATITPILSAENDLISVQILGTYSLEELIGYGENDYRPESIGYCVYSLTNYSADTLYLSGKKTLAPGETVYTTEYGGSSGSGESGERKLRVNVRLSDSDLRDAAGLELSYHWKYDPSTKGLLLSDFTETGNYVDEEVYKTKSAYFSYSNVILAETEYYKVELRNMTGTQDENGSWKVDVQLVIYNTWSSRYLLFDPGKVGADYDPLGDWFDPGKDQWVTLSFTGTGEDPEDVTGQISYPIEGYSFAGGYSQELFKHTLTATLRLSKTAPIVGP